MQWKTKLSPQEKKHITQILRLCTQADVAVGTKYIEHYRQKIENNEISRMLSDFANQQLPHKRSSALLSDTIGLPESEFSAFADGEAMKDKLEVMANIDTNS